MKKEEKKNWIIIFILVIAIAIVSVTLFLVSRKASELEKTSASEKNITVDNVSYTCTKDKMILENCTVLNSYNFSFTNNKLHMANMVYIFVFDSKKEYQSATFTPMVNNAVPLEEFDENALTKKYTYYFQFPFNSMGKNEDIEFYKQIVEEKGFQCLKNNL